VSNKPLTVADLMGISREHQEKSRVWRRGVEAELSESDLEAEPPRRAEFRLGAEFDDYVNDLIRRGRFYTADDVLRAALRLMQAVEVATGTAGAVGTRYAREGWWSQWSADVGKETA
jgi:Arc/MetJ-type ribon-helix-helix transcriptional regulator